MSKSFKEKKNRDMDSEEKRVKYTNRQERRSEKVIHNALRSRDVQTLIKYSEDME